jgi:hypothetical protein
MQPGPDSHPDRANRLAIISTSSSPCYWSLKAEPRPFVLAFSSASRTLRSAGRHSHCRRRTPLPAPNHSRPSTPTPPTRPREASPSTPCPALCCTGPGFELRRPADGQPAAGTRQRHLRPEPHFQSTQARSSRRLGVLPGRSRPEPTAGEVSRPARDPIASSSIFLGCLSETKGIFVISGILSRVSA